MQLLPTPDVWGFAAGAFFGTMAMALAFWRQVSGLEVAIRTGLTFIVSYAAAFLLARYVLRVLLAEAVARRQKALDARRLDADLPEQGQPPSVERTE